MDIIIEKRTAWSGSQGARDSPLTSSLTNNWCPFPCTLSTTEPQEKIQKACISVLQYLVHSPVESIRIIYQLINKLWLDKTSLLHFCREQSYQVECSVILLSIIITVIIPATIITTHQHHHYHHPSQILPWFSSSVLTRPQQQGAAPWHFSSTPCYLSSTPCHHHCCHYIYQYHITMVLLLKPMGDTQNQMVLPSTPPCFLSHLNTKLMM